MMILGNIQCHSVCRGWGISKFLYWGRQDPPILSGYLPSLISQSANDPSRRQGWTSEWDHSLLPFLHSFNQWIIVLFSFHSNELSAMDTVIHSNRSTNRWVIDLHAFITLEFRMAFGAIKSFICQSEIPGLSPGRGSDWLFCKRWSPFVVPLISCFSEDRIWQAELCRYKATAGTTVGLRDIYRGACVDATTE